jgi:hypothetical protein
MFDEHSYIIKNIRDFEQLSNKSKMKNRIINLVTVFFENAIKSVKSFKSFELEKNFLIEKFVVFDESKFKYFDFQKIFNDIDLPNDEEKNELGKTIELEGN